MYSSVGTIFQFLPRSFDRNEKKERKKEHRFED